MNKATTVNAEPGQDGPRVEPCGEGRFVLHCPAEMAWRARTELVEVLAASTGPDGPAAIILDLARVEFLNSAGIGAVFSVRKYVVEGGGQLVVCNAKPSVVRLLATVNLPALIPMVSDLDRAHDFLDRVGGPQQ